MAEQQNLSEFDRYLKNNQDLLYDKHREHFQEIPPPTLQHLPIQSLVTYIYDIFSFDRYQSDNKMNTKIIKSLQNNIQQYLQVNKKKEKEPFTPDITIQILRYCIEHNPLFHVQYQPDKKEQEEGTKDNTLNVEVRSLSEIKGNQEGLPENEKGEKRDSSGPATNQFDQNPENYHFNSNADIIKKNARLAFLSYCKNQMELGGKKTFDILSEEARTMTIGKLLVYAKAYNILSPKITKQLLMRRFKKISEGKRTIDFQKFYILISQMRELEADLFEKLHFHDEDLYKKIKFVKYPFYTQDQNPRQMVSFRSFTNKLTLHNGKSEEELKKDLLNRKNSEQLTKLRSMHRYHQNQTQQNGAKEKLLSPKALSGRNRDYSIDLSFIDKIVAPEDNDHKYLGDYEISHLKNKGQDHYAINNSSILRRKESIIQNIRKRIHQIQRNQVETHKPRIVRRRHPF